MKEDIKSLADELRKSIGNPVKKSGPKPARQQQGVEKVNANGSKNTNVTELISLIQAFDCSSKKQMLHPRLDVRTIALLNGFKLATGIDMNKVVSFSIDYLFACNPDLKEYIKHTLNNIEL